MEYLGGIWYPKEVGDDTVVPTPYGDILMREAFHSTIRETHKYEGSPFTVSRLVVSGINPPYYWVRFPGEDRDTLVMPSEVEEGVIATLANPFSEFFGRGLCVCGEMIVRNDGEAGGPFRYIHPQTGNIKCGEG